MGGITVFPALLDLVSPLSHIGQGGGRAWAQPEDHVIYIVVSLFLLPRLGACGGGGWGGGAVSVVCSFSICPAGTLRLWIGARGMRVLYKRESFRCCRLASTQANTAQTVTIQSLGPCVDSYLRPQHVAGGEKQLSWVGE